MVTANMVRAIRVISVQRGYDPRDYTLIAFGGAGPLHAARLAQGTGHWPRSGAAQSGDSVRDGSAADRFARGFRGDPAADTGTGGAGRHGGGVSDAGRARAPTGSNDEGIAVENRRISRTVDMRYAGQNYELSVPLTGWGDRIRTVWLRWRRGSLPCIAGCMVSRRMTNRCNWSRFASKRPASCQKQHLRRCR